MTIKQHKRIFKGGLAMLLLGATLGITGLFVTPAGAADKYTICHATGSNAHPYVVNTPSESGVDGNTNHFDHKGPVWNPTLKALGTTWGDIIPPVPGKHGGLNWTVEGQAIHANGCRLPDEPDVCQYDPNLDADDPGCVAPVDVCPDLGGVQTNPADCPAPVDVCPDVAGVQTNPADCPAPVDLCPDIDGDQTSASECPTIVADNTVTPTPTPTASAVQVEGIQLATTPVASTQVAAAELPRTGRTTLPLAEFGLGLVLMGAGALLFGREQTATV